MRIIPISDELESWLLQGDPVIRRQVLADLLPGREAEAAFEASRICSEGWGARLLSLQQSDGLWATIPNYRPNWRSTLEALWLLRDYKVDPAAPQVHTAVQRLRDHYTWGPEFGDTRYFEGEVEPCINGRVLALGVYFDQPNERLLHRLLSEQLEDGGWNCAAPGSQRASFNTTLCVLEGLLAYESAIDANSKISAARGRAQEYLLERHLFRSRSTGRVIDPRWTQFAFPNDWHYDILWALDYFRRSGIEPDSRMAEALAMVRAKQTSASHWLLEIVHAQDLAFEMETKISEPSRWITLRALRVLAWASQS